MTHYDWTSMTAAEAYDRHPAVIEANNAHRVARGVALTVFELYSAAYPELRKSGIGVRACDAIHTALLALSNYSLALSESAQANAAAVRVSCQHED